MSSSRHPTVIVHNASNAAVPSYTTSRTHREPVYYPPTAYSTSSNSTGMSGNTSTYGHASTNGGYDPVVRGQYRDRDAIDHRGHYSHRDSQRGGVTVWQGDGLRSDGRNEPSPSYGTDRHRSYGSSRDSSRN